MCECMGENSSEMINKLSRQLEHSRELNDLFIRFVELDDLEVPKEVKELILERIQIYKNDKEQ